MSTLAQKIYNKPSFILFDKYCQAAHDVGYSTTDTVKIRATQSSLIIETKYGKLRLRRYQSNLPSKRPIVHDIIAKRLENGEIPSEMPICQFLALYARIYVSVLGKYWGQTLAWDKFSLPLPTQPN